MLLRRLFPVILVLAGCGPIPTEPDTDTTVTGRVYRNTDWGFQIAIPEDTTWSWTAQTFFHDRDSSGRPRVEVRISKRPLENTRFRPTMVLRPRSLSRGTALGSVTASVEEELRGSFLGYRPGKKDSVVVSSSSGLEWVFQMVSLSNEGDRFLSVVLVRDREGYVFLGSGASYHFPVNEFRDIIRTLTFFD
jgi:hypothetical protein